MVEALFRVPGIPREPSAMPNIPKLRTEMTVER